MLDEFNKTLLVLGVLVIAGSFGVGIWLTNLGGGTAGPASGDVDPNDWGAAASAICDDTNAEVVDMDQAIGGGPPPDVALERGAKILARRADGIAALPAPAGREELAATLVEEMRAAQEVMVRVSDAVAREDFDQADRLTSGLQSEELTRLSYALDVPWCDLFGADDATIRMSATINVLEASALVERYREDAGTYAGADLVALDEQYESILVPGEASIGSADAAGYCVQSTVGNLTIHLRGPDEYEPIAGPC